MDHIKNNLASISSEDAMKLGEDYYYGRNGKDISISEALKCFNIAAKQNNANAEYILGTLYFDGVSVSKSIEKAIYWFEKAALHNHSKACIRLAQCYENGLGVDQNRDRAVCLYEQAAELGETEANFILLRIKKGTSKPSDKKARNATASVNTNKGLSAEEAIMLGDEYYYGKNGKNIDFGQAIKFYNIAAKQNNADAEYILGTLYFDGICVSKNYEKAVYWFDRAASHKHAKAHFRIAQCYEKGLGVTQSHKEALEHYEQADVLGEHAASWVIPRIKEELEKFEHEQKVNAEKARKELMRVLSISKQESKLQKKEEENTVKKDIKFSEDRGAVSEKCSIEKVVEFLKFDKKLSVAGLDELSIPEDNSFDIEDGVLYRYTGFSKNVRIPDNVKKVGAYAFSGNKAIEVIYLPDTVTSIGKGAFEHCENLKTVTMSKKIIDIGEYAFNSCENLQSLVIPHSIKSIGSGAFFWCKNLSISLAKDITKLQNIPDGAFSHCYSLTSITIPICVKHIHKFAFNCCFDLKTIYYAGSEKQAQEIGLMDLKFCHAAIRFNWKK